MAEDWEQYYSGFASNYAPSALSTVNPNVTYVQQQNQQQAAANQAAVQPQQLLDYNGSYSELRGWNPDANAAGNSGPDLLGGSWGSVMSDAALYPETGRAMATPAQIAQMYKDTLGRAPDASGAAWAGGLDVDSLQQALQSSNEYQQRQNTYGDLSNSGNFSAYPGGDYNDVFDVPTYNDFGDTSGVAFANPTGGAQLSRADIDSYYQQFLGRPADDAGAQWAGGFDANALQAALASSAEYLQNTPNPTGGATLSDMYDLPSPGAVETGNGPVQNLGLGDTSGVSRVNDLYQQFLGRDADAEGASFWSSQSDDHIREALLGSQEYQQQHADMFGGNGAQFAGSQDTQPDLNQLPDYGPSPYDGLGAEFGNIQYSDFPLDRSQVPPSVVEKGTPISELPYPNDAERMRLMRTINTEDPEHPEAVIATIMNRLATQRMPNQARYGNTIGTGLEPFNNGTDVVTRGNQYNGLDRDNKDPAIRRNYWNNAAAFSETNPNFQKYSDAIDSVWANPAADPTFGATNYFTGRRPGWADMLQQQNNNNQIGAHLYMGRTPLWETPLPPPRPDFPTDYSPPYPWESNR